MLFTELQSNRIEIYWRECAAAREEKNLSIAKSNKNSKANFLKKKTGMLAAVSPP